MDNAKKKILIEELEKKWKKEYPAFFRDLQKACGALTPLEILICTMIWKNMTSEVIAGEFHCAPGTVEGHRTKIRRKLGLKKGDSLRAHLDNI